MKFAAALERLKRGERLSFCAESVSSVAFCAGSHFFAISPAASVRLSESDFAALYGECDFSELPIAAPAESIDPIRDEEYYSWRHK